MNTIITILESSSLWEFIASFILVYIFVNPEIRKSITRLKFGSFELELKSLREEIAKGNDKIAELESDIESDRRFFEDVLDGFDPNAPVNELSDARRSIQAEARNLTEIESLRQYLNINSTPEQLYVTAVALRERRPVSLLHDLVDFLDILAEDPGLGGFRLNTVWTLTSALHKMLISQIRDGVGNPPNRESLIYIRTVLKKLNDNSRVQSDRPDKPLKGIQGPVKHSLSWVEKGLSRFETSNV